MSKHRHHIIPKHAGGTDDPSNLVELTVEEHAEAHRILWDTYHRIGDKIAWLMLAGKTTEAEDELAELYRVSGKLGARIYHSHPVTPEVRAKISASKRGKPRPDVAEFNRQTKRGVSRGPQSDLHKERKREALKAFYQTPAGLAIREAAKLRMKQNNPNRPSLVS